MEKKIRIIDKRTKEKFLMDDAYYNGYAKICGWKASIVYFSLCRHVNKDQYCFPSVEYMSKQNGVGRNTILSGIKTLKEWNIIDIEKIRDRGGIWKNNAYTLLDKSVWKKHQVPVEDLDNQVPVGTEPRPSGKLDQVPVEDTKETHIEGNTYKETHIAKQASQDITSVIKEMETIDPRNKLFYGNKTQREACRFLIEEYSLESVLSAVNFYINPRHPKIKYLPTITTPCNLRDKWQQLLMLIERKHADLEEVKNNFI